MGWEKRWKGKDGGKIQAMIKEAEQIITLTAFR